MSLQPHTRKDCLQNCCLHNFLVMPWTVMHNHMHFLVLYIPLAISSPLITHCMYMIVYKCSTWHCLPSKNSCPVMTSSVGLSVSGFFPAFQVSLQRGYDVILKDTTEEGLGRGHQQVYKGLVLVYCVVMKSKVQDFLYTCTGVYIHIAIYKY